MIFVLVHSASWEGSFAIVLLSSYSKNKGNKLGLSCTKLSLALATYLLLWTSCEYDTDMDMSWKRMNKSWASHEQYMNKSQTSHE